MEPTASTESPVVRRVVVSAANRLGVVGGLGLLLLMLHVGLDVGLRYLANQPMPGTIEYIQYYYMPIVALFGLAVAHSRSEHIEAPILFDRLPAAYRRHFRVLGLVVVLAFAAAVTWQGTGYALTAFERGDIGGSTGLVIWPARFFVPIGLGMYALHVVVDLIRPAADQAEREAGTGGGDDG